MVTQRHKSWMGSARTSTAVFQSAHGSESVWNFAGLEWGCWPRKFFNTDTWTKLFRTGNLPLTQGCVHGMCSCSSWLLNQTVTSSTGLLSTGGAVLSLSSACSQNWIATISSKCLISHMCRLWDHTIHNQNWQEMTATQIFAQRFERGMEGQKREQGREGKSRHDSLKTAWKKGGKLWKQCQPRGRKLKTGNRNYLLFLG